MYLSLVKWGWYNIMRVYRSFWRNVDKLITGLPAISSTYEYGFMFLTDQDYIDLYFGKISQELSEKLRYGYYKRNAEFITHKDVLLFYFVLSYNNEFYTPLYKTLDGEVKLLNKGVDMQGNIVERIYFEKRYVPGLETRYTTPKDEIAFFLDAINIVAKERGFGEFTFNDVLFLNEAIDYSKGNNSLELKFAVRVPLQMIDREMLSNVNFRLKYKDGFSDFWLNRVKIDLEESVFYTEMSTRDEDHAASGNTFLCYISVPEKETILDVLDLPVIELSCGCLRAEHLELILNTFNVIKLVIKRKLLDMDVKIQIQETLVDCIEGSKDSVYIFDE